MADADHALHFTAQTRLLVVAPHPDDETIATGILIQRVRAAGGEVDILLLTDGDNNPWPQRVLERRLHIGAAARVRWGLRRRDEMLRAMDCLGVAPKHLHPLSWPDLGLTALLLQSTTFAVQSITTLLTRLRPGLVVMPALADRHPDHAAAHVLMRLALAQVASPPRQWTYLVHAAAVDTALIEIDGTVAQQSTKQAALAAHASQMSLSATRMRRLAASPERYVLVSAEQCGGAVLPWRPPTWLGRKLRLDLVNVDGAQSWQWRHAPLRRDGRGVTHLMVPVSGAGLPRFAHLGLQVPSPWIFEHWGWCELG